jgi:probable phosphoglycerate mutase
MPSSMPVTRLLLVRHGATTATEEGRFSGEAGVELSDQGRGQAARLGERLAHQNITAIYSSPLSRALDTARIIADHCHVAPLTRDELREISHGRWEGLTRDEVEDQFGQEYAAWDADPFTFAPSGGETRPPSRGAPPSIPNIPCGCRS